MALQHLRSATGNKRPDPAAMANGQLAVNTAATSPGLFFKDAAGALVKAGPVHVGTTAPNATPASGGQAGNSKGELWLDTTGSDYTLKTWDGSAWREIVVTSAMIKDGTIVNADINASAAIVDTKLATIATAGKVSNTATTAASANTASAIVARDGSGNFTAGTITANLTGTASAIADNTVTSAKIVDGTIVNADVNASAAIAGTKISPDFGSQTIATTGVFSADDGTAAAPGITFTGDTNTGIYSPGADQVAISTNGTGRLFIDASGDCEVRAPNGPNLTFTRTGAASGNAVIKSVGNEGVENSRIVLGGGVNEALIFGTGASGAERMRIDSSGRLLVGTSTSLDTNALLQTYKSSGTVTFRTESGSLANDDLSRFMAVAGTRTAQLGVYKHSGITNPCSYIFMDEEDGGDNYLWVDNSGNLRISATAAHVGTTSGTVVGAQTSDERIKNILGPVTYGLDEIKQLDPVSYALKSDPEQVPHLGFIAQQVLPLVPESVFDTDEVIEEGEPTKLGMEYVSLIPVLVNAIKELSAEVDALKAQLQAQ
jgi:hypothetical protein